MNKVLVEIHIPATGDHFEAFVPIDVQIRDITHVIVNGIVEITNGKYVASNCEQLCMKEPQGLLEPSLCLHDYGVKDGMHLYVV